MTSDAELHHQLQELQTRYAFQEDLLTGLNQTVVEQGRLIERLERQHVELAKALQALRADIEPAHSGDERPPHY